VILGVSMELFWGKIKSGIRIVDCPERNPVDKSVTPPRLTLTAT